MLNDLLHRTGDVVGRLVNSNINGYFLEKIMEFTEDWFTHNIPNFEKCMLEVGAKRKHFLEIGAYEGRSTCWLINNIGEGGTIYSIDPFVGMEEIEERFKNNTREAVKGTKVISCHVKSTSYQALAKMISNKQEFDFIYIDGDHDPATTLADAAMAWGMLKTGGVMLFDDYEYPQEPTKVGIQGFMQGFVGKYDLVLQNYQLAVKKK